MQILKYPECQRTKHYSEELPSNLRQFVQVEQVRLLLAVSEALLTAAEINCSQLLSLRVGKLNICLMVP